MIKIVEGDLLQATENIIGHQVNCMGVMGSGVAKAIRDKYDNVYRSYIEIYNEYKNNTSLLGMMQLVKVGSNKYIANLFGQYHYGKGKQQTDINALTNSLQNLKNYAEINKLSVALPYKIGCVRGGADWDDVYDIIQNIFNDYEVTLYRLDLK